MSVADTTLAPDAIELRRFLELAAELGQIHLVAIRPDSEEIAGRDFGLDVDAAESWVINKNRAGLGVYWSPNSIAPGVHKKPRKENVAHARFVHLDLDPPKGAAWTPAEREAALGKLQDLQPHPSMIVDSGGGFNAYWRLEDECRDPETVEGINRALVDKLGADACWNIDRILRVAGTINWPNKAKVLRGRFPRLAEVVEEEGGEYSIEALRAAFGWLPASAGSKAAPAARVEVPASIERVTPDSIGLHPDHPLRDMLARSAGKDGDRSAHLHLAVREAVGWLLPDEFIFGLMLNPELPVSEHPLDDTDPIRAVRRPIAKWRAELGLPNPSEFVQTDVFGSIRALKETFRMKSAPEAPRPLFRELAPSPAFPIEALGPVLGKAALAIEQIVQLPLSSAANSVLAVASLAAQGRANVVLPVGNGTSRPLSLFFLTVLASGDRKSTADGIALRPVREFERELKEIQGKEQQRYEVEYAAFDTYTRSLKKKLSSNKAGLEKALTELGPAPRPPLSSVIAPSGDQTMEGLFRIYEHGRPSLAMLCDDAGTFLGGHSMKAEQKKSTTGNLCRAWDGSKIERIRGGDGVKDLYDRRLAMHLMAQKDVAAEFLSDDRFADQGLLARFLITAPDSYAGTRFRDDTQYQAEMPRLYAELRPYEAAIAALIRKPIEWKDELNPALGIHLDSIMLTSEARALWVEFYNEIEGRQGHGGDLAGIKEFASKLLENATRLAGVLALCENPAAHEIHVETLADAIKLARFYLAETLRMMGASYVDPELRNAEAVRQWLHERGEIIVGLSTIYQFGPACVRDAKSARAAMSILADHGWVKPISGGAVIDGKKFHEAYEVETET